MAPDASRAQGWRAQVRDKVVIPAVVAVLTSLLTSVGIWWWQQDRLQRWGSQAVVEIDISHDKALSIYNAGVVDISDVAVFLTEYIVGVKTKEAGHLYLTGGIESFSKASNALKRWDRVPSGQTIRYPLTTDQGLKNLGVVFHDIGSSAPREGFRRQYSFRVVFRNSITKQKYVRYVITPAFSTGPSMFNLSPTEAFGGPFDVADKVFLIRKMIRSHQAELFDDAQHDLYR